jgi:hypothetical protein
MAKKRLIGWPSAAGRIRSKAIGPEVRAQEIGNIVHIENAQTAVRMS